MSSFKKIGLDLNFLLLFNFSRRVEPIIHKNLTWNLWFNISNIWNDEQHYIDYTFLVIICGGQETSIVFCSWSCMIKLHVQMEGSTLADASTDNSSFLHPLKWLLQCPQSSLAETQTTQSKVSILSLQSKVTYSLSKA